MEEVNDNLIMVCGGAIKGKSASLRNLRDPEGVWYFGCEAGKKLPFQSKFEEYIIIDPYQVHEAFEEAENHDNVHTLIVDSQTFLMDMFESQYVLRVADTMKGWSNYAQFFKKLMQELVAGSSKNVIFTAHIHQMLNEQSMIMEKRVPVKGQLAKNGIEAFFSCIVTAKTETLEKLKKYGNPLLTITEEDEIVGYKHVFQTKLTKETVGERGMRSPMGMWDTKETFIDNDCQLVMDRLNQFYN